MSAAATRERALGALAALELSQPQDHTPKASRISAFFLSSSASQRPPNCCGSSHAGRYGNLEGTAPSNFATVSKLPSFLLSRAAWFAPTYKILAPIWREFQSRLHPTRDVSQQERILESAWQEGIRLMARTTTP